MHILWQVLVQLLRHKARQGNGGEDGPPLAACGRRRRPAFTWLDGVVVSSAAADNRGALVDVLALVLDVLLIQC